MLGGCVCGVVRGFGRFVSCIRFCLSWETYREERKFEVLFFISGVVKGRDRSRENSVAAGLGSLFIVG